MNNLLDELSMADLKGTSYEIASVVGISAFKKIIYEYGGSSRLCIPKASERDTSKLAQLIGKKPCMDLAQHYGGASKVYIQSAAEIVTPLRNKLIAREFYETDIAKIANKWGLTERAILYIVKRELGDVTKKECVGQTSLF